MDSKKTFNINSSSASRDNWGLISTESQQSDVYNSGFTSHFTHRNSDLSSVLESMSPVTSESNITGMYEMTPTPLLAPSSTDSAVKKPFNFKEKVYDIKKSIIKIVKRKKPSVPRDIPINNPNFPHSQKFVSNRISTSKYNLVTFIPKFLFEQFSNYANVFFLFTSCIQVIYLIIIINFVNLILLLFNNFIIKFIY